MAIGLIIIGDEILSGKRKDAHFSKVVELLGLRGLQLGWAQYLGDDRDLITAALQRSLSSEDIVFSCGGIGATPDDHTRQCAAAALGVQVALHPEAKILIEERIREMAAKEGIEPDLNSPEQQQRLKMGEFPVGSSIVPNPYNRIPGFSVSNLSGAGTHYFVPGFPVMAWPMIEWALDTYHADLFHRVAWQEKSVLAFGAVESALTPLMEELERSFPGVKVFSLPSVGGNGQRRHIELGVKGLPEGVEAAYARMVSELQKRAVSFEPVLSGDGGSSA